MLFPKSSGTRLLLSHSSPILVCSLMVQDGCLSSRYHISIPAIKRVEGTLEGTPPPFRNIFLKLNMNFPLARTQSRLV